MDGGWELRMAKLGHFLLTLSMKFLFHLKVGKVTSFLLSLHVIQSKVNLQLFFFFTDVKHNEGKARPKLTDAVFNKEVCNAEMTFPENI